MPSQTSQLSLLRSFICTLFGQRPFLLRDTGLYLYGREALNEDLQARCLAELNFQVRGKPASKEALLIQERASLLPLPVQSFEARRIDEAKANSLTLVRFDRNDCSVPTVYAHEAVTVVGGIDEVRLVVGSQLVARHRRWWQKLFAG